MPKIPPKLPSWLARSDTEIAKDEQYQAMRRASFTRAKLTEGERLVSRGASLERTAKGNLRIAQEQNNHAQITRETANLADALAMQGRYEEAAQLHPSEDARERYSQIQKAIDLDDSEKCKCPDTVTDDLSLTPRFSARTIYSLKHKKTISVITCSKCGHMNAREPKSRLLLPKTFAGGRSPVADREMAKK
jgi:predicted nucleic-acid-binding Zn-ribbon protein